MLRACNLTILKANIWISTTAVPRKTSLTKTSRKIWYRRNILTPVKGVQRENNNTAVLYTAY